MANYAESGGFWNAPKVQYSQQTHTLLKEMMQESKLTNFQQRQLQNQLRSGGSLPLQCHPTSSAKKKEPPPPKRLPKVLNPKNYHSNGVRSKEVIENSGAYERPQYEPGPSHWFKDSGKEKEKLANLMAFGQDLPPPSEARRIKRKPKEVDFEDEPVVDRFDEWFGEGPIISGVSQLSCIYENTIIVPQGMILGNHSYGNRSAIANDCHIVRGSVQMEIQDRRNFLQEMENLGQADKHRPVIETQISQLIREMELIDKKRSKELEEMIAREEAKKSYR